MAFESFVKTPEITPLLVRLYDTHNLYTLAQDKNNNEANLELTAIMLDLLNVKLNDREQELISDVILTLMKQAQKDLRCAMAERIAVMDNVPLRMVLGFANDDIDVATPVLKYSTVLHDLDLAYILHSKGVEYGRVMANRAVLTPDMIDMLVDTKDFEIAVNLCQNDGIKLTQHAFDTYVIMAKDNDGLSKPLLSRHDLPVNIAKELYNFVGDELKKSIKKKFGSDVMAQAETIIDDVVAEMFEVQTSSLNNFDHLMSHAKGLALVGELKPSLMISNLKRGQKASFLAQFSVFCNIPLTQAKTCLMDESGLSLAKICRAMEISKGDFVSLYLLTKKMAGDNKTIVGHSELSRVMTMYDGISILNARNFLKKIRH